LEALRLGAWELVLCGFTVAALFLSCKLDEDTPAALAYTPDKFNIGWFWVMIGIYWPSGGPPTAMPTADWPVEFTAKPWA